MAAIRRVFGDAAMTAGGALVIIFALVTLDPRVRDQVNLVFDPHHPSEALNNFWSRAGDVARIVFIAARDMSIDHAPLVIFAVAAGVLTLFMLRT